MSDTTKQEDVKALTDTYAAAAAAIREGAKSTDGETTVSPSVFYKFAEGHAVSRQVCDSVHDLMEKYLGGAMVHATDLLADRVTAAKEAGRDGKDESSTVSLRAGPYAFTVTANAHTVSHSPQNPEVPIDKYGVLRVRVKTVKSGIPAWPAAQAKDRLSALLGV
jgi:hypothetical protein